MDSLVSGVMDASLRNLERQYQSDPTDVETMRRLLSAYRRLHNNEDASSHPQLTESSINEALQESQIGYPDKIEWERKEKETLCRIEFEWAEPELADINHFADLLGINPEHITISGGYEDVTRCSCGGCRREIENRLYIEIRIPQAEALTTEPLTTEPSKV